MSRSMIKKISNEEMEYIHPSMKDYDRNHSDMFERPIIVYGKKLTNEQRWKIREIVGDDSEEGKARPGTGDGLKFVWENCVTRVLNVVEADEKGNKIENPELKGEEKNALWNTQGMEEVLYGAVLFFQKQSAFTDSEAKT